MSLLLDALKRAEQEKSARQATTPANDAAAARRAAFAAAPASAAPAANAAKPNLELQPLAQPARSPADARAEAQAAAAAMMHAKAPPARASSSKTPIVLAVAGVLLAVVGAGAAYVWYAMQPVHTPAHVAKRSGPLPAHPIAPGMPAGPIQPITPTEAAQLPPATAVVSVAAPQPRPVDDPKVADGASRPAAREAADPQRVMAELLKEAGMGAAAPVKFSRSERAVVISPEVNSGFAALKAGDLNVARHSYGAALNVDPSNVDALLGMATVEARVGNRDGARAYYRKVLESDPRNATALAGLAATADALAPDMLETQLRGELARAPGSAALHFALGGLYASQARWSEAQAQYFESYRLDPQSADAAFNLAVSLDHVGQPRLAAQYYKRALDTAGARGGRFDAQAARRRLAELAP
jgi:Tfp pilus assembly protein PilF